MSTTEQEQENGQPDETEAEETPDQPVPDETDGVHAGASDPRHDGAAIPETPLVFAQPR